MVDNKWRDIASAINSLAKGTPFSTEKIKKKWFDVKSRAKGSVALFKKEAGRTGGGPNPIPKPTKLQFKISNIIGSICTEGIPGTELFDTGDNQRENNASNSATNVIRANVCNATTVISELPSIVNTKHPFA